MIETTDLYNTLTFVKHIFESFPSDVGHGDVVDIVPEVCVVPQRFTPCFTFLGLIGPIFPMGLLMKKSCHFHLQFL